MPVIANGPHLYLNGTVGLDYFDEYFTYPEVVTALAAIDDDSELTVHLNSPGGYVDDGSSIRNAFAARAGTTTIVIEGMALSSASLIACGGDRVVMNPGSVYMIHEPMVSLLSANAARLRTALDEQAAFTTTFARVYAARSGKPEDEIRAMLAAETWFDPEAAVAAGFADSVGGKVIKIEATAKAFDYRAYAHAPKRLVALAKKKDWRLDGADTRAAASAAPRQTQESSMTDKERADALAAELDTLKAQMSASKDADKTATMAAELEALKAEKAKRENADAIMALDEAKGNEAQAKALADAGVTAEAAKAVLAAGKPVAIANGGPTPEDYAKARMSGGVPQPGGQPGAPADNGWAKVTARLNARVA
ncbi:MAG: peptidase S14 [Fulvimarina sp.]|nr:peptidase S14 [Fulvimarina sp.]